jgi:hypothetical protein
MHVYTILAPCSSSYTLSSHPFFKHIYLKVCACVHVEVVGKWMEMLTLCCLAPNGFALSLLKQKGNRKTPNFLKSLRLPS